MPFCNSSSLKIILLISAIFSFLVLNASAYTIKGSPQCSDIFLAKDNGYSFFWESIFILSKKKYSIGEIPIELPYRSSGSSKMKIKDIINALIYIFIISINKSKY